MSLDEEIQRGAIAQQVIDNPAYQDAWKAVSDGIIDAWRTCPIRDKEGQGELKLMLKLLTDVQRNLEAVMSTGKMAEIQIEREGWLSKTARRFR